MKIIKLTLIVLFSLFVIIFVMLRAATGSFSWSWFSSLANETSSSKSSSVEMAGNNGRAYDAVINGVRCITVVTSDGAGTSCNWNAVSK